MKSALTTITTLAALTTFAAQPAHARRRIRPVLSYRSSPRLRALVKASTSVALVRVRSKLSAKWVRLGGVRERLERYRVSVVRKLTGSRVSGRLVVHGAPTRWPRYSSTTMPSRGRIIVCLRLVAGHWVLTQQGALLPASARARVLHAVRVLRLRAALTRITKAKANILGQLRGRGGITGSLSTAIGRSRYRSRYWRRYVVVRDVEIVVRDGDKAVASKLTDEIKRRGRRCSLSHDKPCQVKLKLSVAPTYGAVVEHEDAKRDACPLSSYNKRCIDKAFAEIDAGNARATLGVTLRYEKRKPLPR
ncbi:MAG: hypothetical protein KC503_39170 [Myxococcales bacterium]|nr:hypothetical protein [Myxococcales bacterium]